MAKKKQLEQAKQRENSNVLLGLVFVLLGLIVIGGIFDKAGVVGLLLEEGSYALLGTGIILVPLITITAGILIIRKRTIGASTREWLAITVGLLSLLGLVALYERSYGGIVGSMIATGFQKAFDGIFASLILGFVAFGSFVFFFDRVPNLTRIWNNIVNTDLAFLKRKKVDEEENEEDFDDTEEEVLPIDKELLANKALVKSDVKSITPKDKDLLINDSNKTNEELPMFNSKKKRNGGIYTPPPIGLLEKDRGKANVGDVKANANIIRRTLMNFGIEVEMDEVTIGPTVTRYALKPAQGVKLSRIVGLQSDLALALAAHPIRIEAPIPGKSLVGIEIPNKTKSTVGLANLLTDPGFNNTDKPLLVALGRNISGKGMYRSIAKMPHLLIAGTTGSGKSVTIHAIITSLLYRHSPDDLRFIFVDPKRVELTLYNSIPHLLTPVITESKKAILALKWAATEMNRRYDILEGESVRDIDSYHKKLSTGKVIPRNPTEEPDRMPYIVIIIDELADIMQAYPRELEAAIVRLAQMSRAVGIHLILSTQRPEVNIITGLIKANVPARIALRVPTQIDSRTILDAGGAEKLLGQGDMLAMIGDNQPERLQSAFISEDEVKGVVAYLKNAYRDDIRDTIELTGNLTGDKTMWSDEVNDNDTNDELYEDARAAVMEAGKASTSYIQRKLRVGYARAARLMDMLEERGVIGASDGAKPREILDTAPKHSVVDEVANEMHI